MIKFLQEVLEILSFAHNINIIHGNIQPENILRRQKDNKLVLTNFTIIERVKEFYDMYPPFPIIIGGSYPYMSSEQTMGYTVKQSDIYSIGIIGIQAFTGIYPGNLPRNYYTGEIDWRERAINCSNSLANILDIMTRHNFSDRYQNANEALTVIKNLSMKTSKKNRQLSNWLNFFNWNK